MKKLLIIQLLQILLMSGAVSASETLSAKKHAETSLMEAMAKKMITVKITGSFADGKYEETIDQEGFHFGKCMAISVVNNTDSAISINLACGTLFAPLDTDIQVMVATHSALIDLKPKARCLTKFYAMCTQMHKYAPTNENAFKVHENKDTTLLKIAAYLEQSYNQNILGQHAIWAYTDNADSAVLADYGADNNILDKTIAILNAVHLVTALNRPAPLRRLVLSPTRLADFIQPFEGIWLFAVLSLVGLIVLIRKWSGGVMEGRIS